MKKLTSLLLAFAMLFSLAMPAVAAEITGDSNTDDPTVGNVTATYTPSATEPDPATKTIYFDNTEGWTTVYAYAWNDSGHSLGGWPGSAMTKVEGTESIYSVEVPADAVNIIFNNGAVQTLDQTIPTDGKNLFTYTTSVWSVYGSTTDPATKTIYFDNTEGWTTVYAYAWNDSGHSLGEWPGSAMTKVEGTESIYSIEVPTVAVNIIFNNGSGAVTGDLTIPTDDKNLYTYSTEMWSVYGSTTEPEPDPEAKWGSSKDNLTESGTLADAIAAAGNDSSIAYIQLQDNVTTDTGYIIESGVFTLDLNGKKLASLNSTCIKLTNYNVKVTMTDTAGGGEVTSESTAYEAVFVWYGSLVIDGGSYSAPINAIYVSTGSAEINGGTFTSQTAFTVESGGTLTITDGTFVTSNTTAGKSVATAGTTTIKGGTFTGSDHSGAIYYGGGTLDMSEYKDVNGLTLSQHTGSEMNVPNENIKLPAGYVFKDSGDNTVTTLASGTKYTIGMESTEPTYNVNIANGITGGTVSVDKTTAKQGDTVTVTFTPNDGYVLFAPYVYAIDDTSNNVTLTPSAAGTYTFAMPAYAVRVSAAFAKDGKARDDLYFNNGGNTGWTNVTAAFYTDDGTYITMVGLTMAENGVYTLPDDKEIPNFAYRVSFMCHTSDRGTAVYDIPTDNQNMFILGTTTDTYGDYEGTWGVYNPSQPPEDTTSAEIVWGSMAFTYTDGADGAEGAWSNDGSTGAGTVTVKNTGTTTFTAQVAYTAVEEYAEITGTFDADSAELKEDEEKTFTLTLKNKPNKAISAGTKIGSVTITINEAAES